MGRRLLAAYCDFDAILAPLAGQVEGLVGLVKNFVTGETVSRVTRNSGPHGEIVGVTRDSAADSLNGPDSAVLGGVFKDDGIPRRREVGKAYRRRGSSRELIRL